MGDTGIFAPNAVPMVDGCVPTLMRLMVPQVGVLLLQTLRNPTVGALALLPETLTDVATIDLALVPQHIHITHHPFPSLHKNVTWNLQTPLLQSLNYLY